MPFYQIEMVKGANTYYLNLSFNWNDNHIVFIFLIKHPNN